MSLARRCDHCQELEEERPRLVWQLSLPARNDGRGGPVFDFCSDACLRDFIVDRIAARAAEFVEREKARAAVATPSDVARRVSA